MAFCTQILSRVSKSITIFSKIMAVKVTPLAWKTLHQPQTVQSTLKFFLVILLFLGFFPVSGLLKNSKNLKFKWLSSPTLYTIYIILFSCIMCFFQIFRYATGNENGAEIGKFPALFVLYKYYYRHL